MNWIERVGMQGKLWYERPWYLSEYYHVLFSVGCDNACSYCPIKHIRPHMRALPFEQIMHRFNSGLNDGFKKFYFHSDDLGAYRSTEGYTIWDALQELHSIHGDYQLKLWSISPHYLVEYEDTLMRLLEHHKIVSIVTPLQHASQKMLDYLNRRYAISEVIRILQTINQRFPQVEIITEFMVGFESEEEKDLQRIVDIFRIVNLSPAFPAGAIGYFPHPCLSHSAPREIGNDTIVKNREAIVNRLFTTKKRLYALQRLWKKPF